MTNSPLIIPITVLTSLTLLVGNIKPSQAQTGQCTALPVVGGTGTSVTKKVSGALGIANNHNTDFAVPTGRYFKRFVATIRSGSSESVNLPVKMFLKYSDGTVGQVFNGDLALQPKQAKQLTGSPRVDAQPFQVNVRIGDLVTSGYSYTLSVSGCK